MLPAKSTIVTRPAVGGSQRVKLTPHVGQLTVEGVNGGVLLPKGAGELQSGDVEGVAARLIESLRTLPHRLSGRQRCYIHSKLYLHAAKEDLSSASLSSSPVLIVTQVGHVLLNGPRVISHGLSRGRSTIRPSRRLRWTNRNGGAGGPTSEVSP